MKLRILTYNIQHGHVHLSNHIDLSKACDVIREYDPDIVGLNEVRGRGEAHDYTAQAEYMASYLGYHCYFGCSIYVGGQNPYGNAILSKYPITESSVIRIPDPITEEKIRYLESRSICRAVIELPCPDPMHAGGYRKIAVYSSHFGLSHIEQEHAVSTAVEALRREALPHVIMGDFNVTPDNRVLAPLYSVMTGTDDFVGDKKSFPSDAPNIKIDYIFVSNGIAVENADIPQVIASDHCPMYADIELR